MQRLFLSKSQTFLTVFRDHPYLTEPVKPSCVSSSSLELFKLKLYGKIKRHGYESISDTTTKVPVQSAKETPAALGTVFQIK